MSNSFLTWTIYASLLLSQAVAQTSPTSIDPSSVSTAEKTSWCNGQTNACSTLCNGASELNTCDTSNLDWSCTCSNGTTIDASTMGQYTDTMPYYICEQSYTECVSNNANNATGQADCASNIGSYCGTVAIPTGTSPSGSSSFASGLIPVSSSFSSAPSSSPSASTTHSATSTSSSSSPSSTSTSSSTQDTSSTLSSSSSPSTSLASSTTATTASTTSTAPSTASSTGTTTPNPKSSSNTGLKIGLGVGISLSVLLLSAIAYLFYRTHKRTKDLERQLAAQKATPNGNELGGSELPRAPYEMGRDGERFEIEGKERPHEMGGQPTSREKGASPAELAVDNR